MACTRGSRILQIHPTRRCNLRCLHCYSSSGPEERGELPTALLADALTDAAAEGYTVASFSGGEPLLYRPLRELLDHAHGRGMATTVTSNGMLLDERRLAGLTGAVDLLAISLDGTPASHDRMRADPKAFATMASRLGRLRDSGIPFGFIFTLTQNNLHELEWVAEFALAEGARLLQIHPLEAAGRAIRELGESFPDAIEESYAYLLAAHLQQSLHGRLQVQLDLLSRRLMADQPNLFFAGESDPGGSLAERVRPLVIEADGTVVPIEHGFDRSFSLGSLRDARLCELAPRWLAGGGYVRFRDLCGRAFAAVTAEDRPPLADWSAALRSAAIQPAAAGA
jgi:MoaA/NifB/PqqE/SkfB family radical SAM enzyme